jgi:UDP-N-acetylmuramoylalanine--D-glutamate ligase
MEWIADIAGVRYINDSKGTNVGATLAAVAGLSGHLVLIAGGDGKGQDFAPLAEALRGRARLVVLIGRDATKISAALSPNVPNQCVTDMAEAVAVAAATARSGDTVLLSPACSSLDMFRDYAHRGAVFRECVSEIAA